MRSTRSNNLVSHLLKGSFTNSATPFFFLSKNALLTQKKNCHHTKVLWQFKKKI